MRTVALAAGVVACTAFAAPVRAQEAGSPSIPAIVTTGEVTVRRAPDRAIITVAVEARAQQPRQAQRRAADGAAAVLARLARAGIPTDALRTVGYDLQQESDVVDGRRVPKGFAARNTIEATVDQVARAGEIVDAAVQAGATSVEGIRFDLTNRDAVEREAIRLAVADARHRAEAAADGAGVSLGRILRIETFKEARPFAPRPMGAVMRAGAATTPIEPGLVDIDARVTLTVAIK